MDERPQSKTDKPTSTIPLEPFCKLADPSSYVACAWDLTADMAARRHWVDFFKRHIRTILKLGHDAGVARGRVAEEMARAVEACSVEFDETFDALVAQEACDERLTILALDARRDALLQKHGFADAFIDLKNRENQRMLPLLPRVCTQIDDLKGPEQLRAVIEGIFAGNIFDMGAEATASQFLSQDAPDFFQTRSKLPKRPWLIDDFDALQRRLLDGTPYRKAVFFVDNAGSDFLLGALPMIRWLAQRGTRVVLTANERPTLNDMTIHDVNEWWPRILRVEPSLRDLPIDRASSGTGEPLIDLLGVSAELNRAAADADLVILEGMGRGVESNIDARFNCDALNLAMLKDEHVAARIGGKLYDVVCQFNQV
ncbi:MAG TPA: ARMT1-like domain-containing protein [Tepidisphaeraceae bacterium]|nr:ARMT1-like domain-containing protein [Tepidisphaeraceae bacterium]